MPRFDEATVEYRRCPRLGVMSVDDAWARAQAVRRLAAGMREMLILEDTLMAAAIEHIKSGASFSMATRRGV